MEKRLQDLTDVEIKALCYDLIAQQQQTQNNLNVLNQELQRRAQSQQGVPTQQSTQVIPRLGTTEVV
jgi:hypothetical protein